MLAVAEIPGECEEHVCDVHGSNQNALQGTGKDLRTPNFFRVDSGGSLQQLRPAIHKFIQESVAKGELTMTLQTSGGPHLAFAGMNSVCARFVKVLKLQHVFEKILNLKKDRNDPVMMISQGHLELTFQSHLMVAYGT